MNTEIDELTLTAYALGELEDHDRAAVEAHLAGDPAGRAHVEEVRATARLLTGELAREEAPALTPLHLAAIEQRLEGAAAGAALPIRRNWGLWASLAASVVIVCSVMAGVLPRVLYRSNGTGTGPGTGTTSGDPAARATARAGSTSGPIIMFPSAVPPPGLGAARTVAVGPTGRGAVLSDGRFLRVADRPLTTVPVLVGTGSYADLRRLVAEGATPPFRAVRIEELINSFDYAYAPPRGGDALAVDAETTACPWEPAHRLVRVALKAADHVAATKPTSPVTTPVVATNVKLTMELNPAAAAGYRVIGYDGDHASRDLGLVEADPAADVRAGQSVTVLIEIVPKGKDVPGGAPASAAPGLKYHRTVATPAGGGEFLTVSVRYRPAEGGDARSTEASAPDAGQSFEAASAETRFACAVAALGMALRETPHRGAATAELAATLAAAAKGEDPTGARAGFVDVVNLLGGKRP